MSRALFQTLLVQRELPAGVIDAYVKRTAFHPFAGGGTCPPPARADGLGLRHNPDFGAARGAAEEPVDVPAPPPADAFVEPLH